MHAQFCGTFLWYSLVVHFFVSSVGKVGGVCNSFDGTMSIVVQFLVVIVCYCFCWEASSTNFWWAVSGTVFSVQCLAQFLGVSVWCSFW